MFDLMTLNIALRVALGCGIIFTKFDLRQLIRAWIIAFFDADTLCHAVTLTFELLTLNSYGTSGVWHKLCTQFEQNRIIHGWDIDDLARFRVQFQDVCGRTDRAFSGVRGPNFIKLGQDIGRSSHHCTFVLEFGYLAAFSNAGGSKLSDVENDAKFSTFWPHVVIRGCGRDVYTNCWSFTYDGTAGIHSMAIHCTAAEHGELIKKK